MFIYVVETENGKHMGGINATGKRVSAEKATSFFVDVLKGIKGDMKAYPKEMTICYDGKDIKYSLEAREITSDPLQEQK